MKILITILVIASCVGCTRRDAERITIDISRTGQFSMQQPMTKKELYEAIKRHYREHGDCPVLIRAADDTPHLHVRTAMDICSAVGFWRITLADQSGSAAEFPNGHHRWEPEEGVPTPSGMVTVAISARGFDFAPFRDVSADGTLLITCTEGSKHGDLVAALRQCEEHSISNVYVGSVFAGDLAEQPPERDK